jgi:hypothetical protein
MKKIHFTKMERIESARFFDEPQITHSKKNRHGELHSALNAIQYKISSLPNC